MFIAGFSVYCLFDPLIYSVKEVVVNVVILFLATKLLDFRKEKNIFSIVNSSLTFLQCGLLIRTKTLKQDQTMEKNFFFPVVILHYEITLYWFGFLQQWPKEVLKQASPFYLYVSTTSPACFFCHCFFWIIEWRKWWMKKIRLNKCLGKGCAVHGSAGITFSH